MQIHCAYDELADPVSLVPNPRNPNRHPDRRYECFTKKQPLRAASGFDYPNSTSRA